MNSKFVYESKVISVNNADYFYISKNGYTLIHASNGDWNAAGFIIKGIANQGDSCLVFLEKIHNGNFRVNLIWTRDN